MPVFTMKGVGDLLEVYEDHLDLTPKGLMGFMSKGLKGTKSIPFDSISAIQFKKAGLTSGYLQFTIPGGKESKGGLFAAASDENTFMFAKDNNMALEIKSYIEKRKTESRQGTHLPKTFSTADELLKLANLKSQGIINEEEFQRAKLKLIG